MLRFRELGKGMPGACGATSCKGRSSLCRCRIRTKWEKGVLESLLLPEAQRKPGSKGVWEIWLADSRPQHHRADSRTAVAKTPKEVTGTNLPHLAYLVTSAFDYGLYEVWPKPSHNPVPDTNLNSWHF